MSLHKKIASMGPLTGRSMAEITAVCGKPSSVHPHKFSDVGEGTRAVWKTLLFSFGLNFDGDGNCCGIYFTHDISAYIALLGISVVLVGGILLLVKLL